MRGQGEGIALAVSAKHVKFLFLSGHAPPSTQLPTLGGKAKKNGPPELSNI